MNRRATRTFAGENTVLRLSALVAAFLIAGVLAVGCGPGKPDTIWKGEDFSGAEVDFPAVLQGRPTVLIFWASWCPYCRAFFPYLGEIQHDYGADKINILAIDVFEDGVLDPAEYVQSLGFPMITVANGDSIAKRYSVYGTPGLMIMDGQGNIVWTRGSTDLPAGKTVAELWAEQVREQLDQLL
jgi:thiol-disulfide isomerase/thioredoxin